jgi:hypothetical protein
MFEVSYNEEKSSPSSYVIKLTGTAPEAQGAFSGDIVVYTDMADEKTVKIPYFGFTRSMNAPGTAAANPWDSNPSLLAR